MTIKMFHHLSHMCVSSPHTRQTKPSSLGINGGGLELAFNQTFHSINLWPGPEHNSIGWQLLYNKTAHNEYYCGVIWDVQISQLFSYQMLLNKIGKKIGTAFLGPGGCLLYVFTSSHSINEWKGRKFFTKITAAGRIFPTDVEDIFFSNNFNKALLINCH